ncbi:hypothetical protein J2S08_002296 [Bacillus chungangensis]|uniref:Uncharacterized protein n=1 Tax=Bacillus chungangensis TaxID=587633 RepID=A0ABT9WT42_9BACI|nr:hypothetical protein [Bacillus chungangensis]
MAMTTAQQGTESLPDLHGRSAAKYNKKETTRKKE